MWVSVSKGRKWRRFSQTREEGAGPPPQQSACPVDTPANRYKLGKRVNSGPHTPEGHFNMKTQRKEAVSQFPTPRSPKCAPQNSRPRRHSYTTRTHTHAHMHTHTHTHTYLQTHTQSTGSEFGEGCQHHPLRKSHWTKVLGLRNSHPSVSLTLLSRCHSHTRQATHLKCRIQWALVYSELRNHHHSRF